MMLKMTSPGRVDCAAGRRNPWPIAEADEHKVPEDRTAAFMKSFLRELELVLPGVGNRLEHLPGILISG